jgi:hypothetical protein
MEQHITDPWQTGANAAKRDYSGTSPAKTLAWIIAAAVLFCGWLAYTYSHTFGTDQYPGASPTPQGVAYVNDHSSVVRGVAQVPRNGYDSIRGAPEARGVVR